MQYMTEANEPPRKNMKVVTLKTHDGRRPDYTSGAEINDDEAPPIEDEPEEAIPAADDENQDAGHTRMAHCRYPFRPPRCWAASAGCPQRRPVAVIAAKKGFELAGEIKKDRKASSENNNA